jgi:hypothetical protein
MPEEMRGLPQYNRKKIIKKRQAIKSTIKRKLHTANKPVDKVYQERLEIFFDKAAKIIAEHPFCHECELSSIQTFIPEMYYRAASAHILPKRKEHGFPSIADNIENLLVLSPTCGHHKKYDNTWEDAATMKVWPLAVKKIKKMLPFIAASEMKNLHQIVRDAIAKTIENDS